MFTSVQTDQKGKFSVARTDKGRLVTISDNGSPVFETATLAGENAILLTANDRVVLAPTKRGSIITYSWPKKLPPPKGFDPTQFSTEFKMHKVGPAALPWVELLCCWGLMGRKDEAETKRGRRNSGGREV